MAAIILYAGVTFDKMGDISCGNDTSFHKNPVPLLLQIADFGLSNLYHKDKLLQTFCGSPLYASPEIVNGRPYHGPEVRMTK